MTGAEHAPAKVNLCLHVTGRRGDGYHLLDSIVVFAGVGDTVSARADKGLSLAITGPQGPGLDAGDDNLVLRAARLTGARDLALTLDKHLPQAAGIGGGSADAAATLRLIARITGQGLPDAAAVAALGADIPVCLSSRPARMRGVGEVLDPLPPLPPFAMLLVNPGVAVPTAPVFQALARRDNPPLPDRCGPWPDRAAFFDWLRAQRNDLQAPACAVAPAITSVLQALGATTGCALARMSGSGATCFGLFADMENARAAERALRAAHPDWWIAASPALTGSSAGA